MAQPLISLFSQIPALEDLNIENVEDLVALDPRLPIALSALKDLTKLELTGVGLRTIGALKSLRSPVKEAHLGFLPEAEHHILSVLESLPDTLQVLYLENAPLPLVPPQSARTPLRLVHVHTLSIYRMVFLLDTIIPLFPNVQHLFVESADIYSIEIPAVDLRARNRAALANPSSPWVKNGLKIVVGDVADLYTAGLTCSVEYMELKQGITTSANELFNLVRPIVEETRPASLCLDVSRCIAKPPRASFLPRDATWLKDLEIKIGFPDALPVGIQEIMVCLGLFSRVRVETDPLMYRTGSSITSCTTCRSFARSL